MPPGSARARSGRWRNRPGARTFSSGAMSADDDAGREQGEADHRKKEKQIARVDHAALEAVVMRDHREGGDRIDQSRARPARHEIGHGIEAVVDAEETDDDREDE